MRHVLIVDDSAVICNILKHELSKCGDIEIVGTAKDPYEAREKIAQLRPDIITLDINMPRMDGLSFLDKLMKHYPLPVIIFSSLGEKNSEIALQALEIGAVEVICKPQNDEDREEALRRLVQVIRSVCSARDRQSKPSFFTEKNITKKTLHIKKGIKSKLLAVGASTGGIQAIETVLKRLPANSPPTVIVQHLPATFTESFAKRLNSVCAMEVREACDYDELKPGLALLAPGDYHMTVEREQNSYYVRLRGGPKVHFQRPSVDILFESVANSIGANAIGVLLTGMGKDGAKGLLAMRKAGSMTFVQDEKTCVVFGMPKAAIELGAASRILPLNELPQAIPLAY